MYVAENKLSTGRIFKYNVESGQKDIIYSQGSLVRSLAVIGARLWYLELDNGLKSISINGDTSQMAQTVSTTGIGCTSFFTMYFAAGKKLEISMKLVDLHNIFYTSANIYRFSNTGMLLYETLPSLGTCCGFWKDALPSLNSMLQRDGIHPDHR